MSRAQDYYEVLGVPPQADPVEIRRAYRQRVKQIHPDVAQDKAGANEAFIRLREAYAVLSDPEARARYDATRPRPRRTATGTSAPPGNRPFREPSGPTHPPPGGDTWTRYHRTLTVADLLERAMREMAAGRNAYARRDLSELLAREPQNPDALILMGRLYQVEGRLPEWIRILEEGIRINPGQAAMRLALNEAQRLGAEGYRPAASPGAEAAQSPAHHGWLAAGLVGVAAALAWAAFKPSGPFVLDVMVPVRAALIQGGVACAFVVGFTAAVAGWLDEVENELMYQPAHGATRHRCFRGRRRRPHVIGPVIPPAALLHFLIAIGLMAALAIQRGAMSRSLWLVVVASFLLAFFMALVAPSAAGAIMWWCPGWLMAAMFTGWVVGDTIR